MTIVLVTNLVQQAHRLADQTAFLNRSQLVEVGDTEMIFSEPEQPADLRIRHGRIRLMTVSPESPPCDAAESPMAKITSASGPAI